MRQLSASGEAAVGDLARRHGFSPDAVASMLNAVASGNGGMAQFAHAEFGGSGQWMRGGMTMVGDMFDSGLKRRVEALCDDLARLLGGEGDLFEGRDGAPSGGGSGGGDWWPGDLGRPSSTGSQNNARYAYFAGSHRLAVDTGGSVTIYDTLDHQIGGVSQQQSGRGSMSFTSQHGPVDLASLPVVSGQDKQAQQSPAPQAKAPSPAGGGQDASGGQDVMATIRRLAELRAEGILTEDEFAAKKADLLGRL